jgi:hypothetical protein
LRGSIGLIVMMRPAPTLQLAFQMRTGVRHFEDRNRLGDFGKYKNAQ